ncbi:hypothetical protein COZ61_00830 [Candidatus Berkelbacteria bacterium CG_4_8_14_3_um_filter_33_6]|uniref:DUF8173 domain-containing protein n=1 Tax=Candidatus Berkelbacteria bacterium CG_4_10_14_0_2_um_filter_35_9_33_12 TaxID=1974499 RepID=A0A2M7W4V0_9BACT|nr:MAG: hypothetical protein COX10_01280 [Candidatus Berkelbacteria bacterium CG23_combo_of_CG06-09_8_20_14_all_33_15]PIS08207.1 MAG: hypothetical protein COT76_02830 [Candidatus Berkelbacteria bacterium CG10_big_fil_rev_8_21_14_0_10_33_10]PIX31231.1 MAG: hypothetical protein COZ61_00830 [Candidatus Berkelbacteria bacterium CG_4_8_14_3_um_filter_33_6]PIZ28166.1 MAG: hypothetical protein COY43_01985 [Candidatus Berkelbacteria bacterium CG_4_10_14_0_8_um_filter_35_9_33_8]PJA20944.1 MAG: hypotheti
MKKVLDTKIRSVFVGMISIILGLLIISSAQATQFEIAKDSTNLYLIKENEVVEDNLIVIGQDFTTKGKINGDLLVIGTNIALEGEVDGNVIAIGSNIKSNLKKVRNIYLVADRITLSSQIERDLYAVARNLNLTSPTDILGSLYAIVSDFERSEEVTIGSQTIIKNFQEPNSNSSLHYYSLLISFFSCLLVGFLMLCLWGKKIDQHKKQLVNQWGAIFLKGTVGLIVILPIIVILILSQVGISLAMIVLALFLISFYLSKIIVAYLIGRKILPISKNIAQLAIGLLIVYFLINLPVFGGLIYLVVTIFGFGIIMTINQKNI